jgi:hypothetical protein
VVQRPAQFVDGEVGVLPDLQRRHLGEAQFPGAGGEGRGGFDLPHPLLRVGLQREHPEQVAEHVAHGPRGAVGRAGPVVGAQVVDEGEQAAELGPGERHGLLVLERRDGVDGRGVIMIVLPVWCGSG